MQQHYQLSDDSYKSLLKAGITKTDLFKSIQFFDPNGDGAPISQISLFHYIDKKGNFNDLPRHPHRVIARALFDQLPIKEKCSVAEYMESWEGDFEDE